MSGHIARLLKDLTPSGIFLAIPSLPILMATITEKPPVLDNLSSSSINKDAASDSPGSSQLEVAKLEDGVDVSVGLVAYHEQDTDLDPIEAKKLLNKLDWHILPLLCGLYTRGSFNLICAMPDD